MRVAIAEDDEASCKLLQAYLKTYSEKTGVVFEIDCFPDGMKLVNAYKPVYDLLLLDIEMPLLDGMSAARRIRKLDQNVFIIFIIWRNMPSTAMKSTPWTMSSNRSTISRFP